MDAGRNRGEHLVRIYVEGGGSKNTSLSAELRLGFQIFFSKARVSKKPRVVACGGREAAYDAYCSAVREGKPAMLLIDSEVSVQAQFEEGENHTWRPWEQLKSRKNQKGEHCDPWDKIGEDTDCHLMVQVMESWFLADVDEVEMYFGSGFKKNKFPKDDENIERIAKSKIENIFKSSTNETKNGKYDKGRDSFKILGRIDPNKIMLRSKWANRFILLVNEKMESSQ
jgi:hypothetical protein